MITRIQAKNYRCFRDLDVSLDRFHVMVGPNASGKSTLFDVVAFLADMLRDKWPAAIRKRTRNFQDLVWGRPRGHLRFKLAVDLAIPENPSALPGRRSNGETGRVLRYEETVWERDGVPCAFGDLRIIGTGTATGDGDPVDSRIVFGHDGHDEGASYPEIDPLGARMPAMLFELERSWPKRRHPETWHALYELAGIADPVVLDGETLRQASPRDYDKAFSRDGSSLPWNVLYLREEHPDDYREWIRHVQTVLPELQDIRVLQREDERSAYLMLRYANGVDVPSWMTSEGTLRLLALTILAYLPVAQSYRRNQRALHEIILIEEAENGVHPLALDAIYDSLASVYRGQVLVTTHSPTFLGRASPKQALSFARRTDGSARVIRGTENPYLVDWHKHRDTSLLFAKDVIG